MRKILLFIMLFMLISQASAYDTTFYEGNKTLVIQQSVTGKTLFTVQQVSVSPGLTEFEEVFNITSYLTSDYTFSASNIRFSWKKHLGENNITGYEFYLFKPSNYSIVVDDYSVQWNNISSNVSCGFLNLSTCEVWTNISSLVVIGNHTEVRDNSTWIKLNNLNGKVIKPGKSYIIKVVFHKKAEIGAFSIQTIPSFVGVSEPRMTWWNLSKLNSSHSIVLNTNNTVINMSLHNSSGVSNTTDYFSNGTFNKGFTGINFTKNNLTEIPFWIDYNGSSTAIAHVNISSISAPDYVDIYHNERNLGESAGNASSNTTTFKCCDDWNRPDGEVYFDWTTSVGTSLIVTKLLAATSSVSGLYTMTKPFTSNNKNLILIGKYRAVVSDQVGFFILSAGGAYFTDGLGIWLATNGNNVMIYDNGSQKGSVAFTFTIGVVYNFEIRIKDNGAIDGFVWADGTIKPTTPTITVSAFTPASSGTLAKISTSDAGNVKRYIDNFFVYSYTDPTPSFGGWGVTESPLLNSPQILTNTICATWNQTVNVATFYNGVQVQTDDSVTQACFTNSSMMTETVNVTMSGSSTGGSKSITWNWNSVSEAVKRIIVTIIN